MTTFDWLRLIRDMSVSHRREASFPYAHHSCIKHDGQKVPGRAGSHLLARRFQQQDCLTFSGLNEVIPGTKVLSGRLILRI